MSKNKVIISENIKDTAKIACYLLNSPCGNVIALVGDLGAGKTALTKEIAKILNIKEKITSPTFVLIKEYPIKNKEIKFNKLVHVDCYRIKSVHDAVNIGLDEYINEKENLVVIEWADKIMKILPDKKYLIKISHYRENQRKFEINKGKKCI